MTEFSTILVDKPEPGVTRVTLNRPEALNAYTPTMCRELCAAIEEYASDDEQRCLVLTGAGRGFCSGGDIKKLEGYGIAHGRMLGHAVNMREGVHRLALTLQRLDKPTIAAINGPAVAGGLALALMCDLRLAADTALLGDTSGRYGMLPDEGGTWLFPRLMRYDLAIRMIWLSEVYDAETALTLGLVTEVVGANELADRALDLARAICAKSPLAVRMSKRLTSKAMRQCLADSLSETELAILTVNDSADAQEGIAAFADKRLPRFTGK